MSDGRWFDGWPLPGLAAAGLSFLPNVPMTPAAMTRMVTEQLVGRRLTAKAPDGEVKLTLTELDYPADSLADNLRLATGRVGDVAIVAEDVEWPEPPDEDGTPRHIPLRRVTVLAEDVRVRSLPTPAVIPKRVEVRITVAEDVLRERVAEVRPGIIATPGEDGLLHIRWAKHPDWGHLTLEAVVDHDAVVLIPRKVHIGQSRRFRAPKRFRPIVLQLPELPPGTRLTAVEPHQGELVLHTVAEEWPERLSRIPLPDLVSWLTTTAMTLTLPKLGSRP